MANETEGLITALYNGLLLRNPTTEETTYWTNQIDLGVITPVGLVLLGAENQNFIEVTLPIAMMYEAAFGSYATTGQLMAWRVAYDTGLGLADIGQNFIMSNDFKANNAEITSTAQYLQALASSGLGRDVSQVELDTYVPLIDAGVLDYGDILLLITQVNSRGMHVALAMLDAGLNGVASESANIDSLYESPLPEAINTLIVSSSIYSELAPILDLVEDSGQLLISGPLSDDMALNLTELTVTVGGLSQELISGNISDVISVDATGLTGTGLVDFVGSADDNIYTASSIGDTIRGGGGDDQLTGGAGVDRFIIESTAAENGLDTISDFQITASDILDLSSFLTVTGTSHIDLVDAESVDEVVWGNGDVLVVEGYGLITAADIASLFGAGAPFAAPTNRGKAVVIATDIVGDASIWFLVNQVTTNAIAPEELTQVAELTAINNLGLQSLTAENFA